MAVMPIPSRHLRQQSIPISYEPELGVRMFGQELEHRRRKPSASSPSGTGGKATNAPSGRNAPRHGCEHVLPDPFAVQEHALLVAARAEVPDLARVRS